jgi:hypothetical protein
MAWSGRPSMPAGHEVTATDMDAILDQIDSVTAPGWTSYTPTWTASSVNPAIGNGSITGRYRRASGGDLLHFQLRIAMGSTTTFGTGVWRVTYPSPAPSATALTFLSPHGYAIDASNSGATWAIVAKTESTYLVMGSGGGSLVTPTIPFTWATNDVLTLEGFYQPV